MGKLKPKQEIAAFQIAIGQDKKKAAKAAKITPQTLSAWLKEPAFEAQINKYRYECLQEAQAKFTSLACQAVETLEKSLIEAKSERVKLEAARFILNTIQIYPYNERAGVLSIGKRSEADILHERKVEKAKEENRKYFDSILPL